MNLLIGFLIGWCAGTEIGRWVAGIPDWYRAVPIYILLGIWITSRVVS